MIDLEYLHLRILLWLARHGFLGIAAFFAAPWLILAAMVAWSFWRRRRDA